MALDETHLGIVCLTRDNCRSPWVLFEAGALSKSLSESKLIPLLLDVEPSTLEPPLSHFQAVRANKEGVQKLVRSIYRIDKDNTRSTAVIDELFEMLWPRLNEKLHHAKLVIETPRIALFGATTREIEADPKKTHAIKKFYRTLLELIERTPYGINCCGAEPIRRVFFDAYCEKIYNRPEDQISAINRRVRWYWFAGDDKGFSYPPAFYEHIQGRNAIDRTLKEVSDSNLVVALAGRAGTREQVQRLLSYHVANHRHGIDLCIKKMILLGWFGGTVKELIDEHGQGIRWLLDSYSDLEPEKEVVGWEESGIAEQLAERLVHYIEGTLAGEDNA